MRIEDHPILGKMPRRKMIEIEVDGRVVEAFEGEPIAAALLAAGIRVFGKTPKRGKPRGLFCGIGQCTDCLMTVNEVPDVRVCVTPVKEGMRVQTQIGFGRGAEEIDRD